jgi:hypothetical protein
MFYIPFWVLMGVFSVMALVTIKLKGFSFIDLQVIVAIVAISLIFDMVFCKWLQYYSYVVTSQLKAFYSLVFCLIGYPAIGLIFLKFLPSSIGRIVMYIAVWSAALTLLELFIKSYGIVIYAKWNLIPYSPLIYILSFVWEYGYYKVLEKRIR